MFPSRKTDWPLRFLLSYVGLTTGRFGRSFLVSGLDILGTVWSGVLTPGKTEKTGLSTGLFATYVIVNRSHFFIIVVC